MLMFFLDSNGTEFTSMFYTKVICDSCLLSTDYKVWFECCLS